jgi:hypothetical protein
MTAENLGDIYDWFGVAAASGFFCAFFCSSSSLARNMACCCCSAASWADDPGEVGGLASLIFEGVAGAEDVAEAAVVCGEDGT